jgi:hypothetical protein
MKKVFLLLMLSAFAFIANVNAQIPNSDFESNLYDGSLGNWGNVYLMSVTIDDSTGVSHGDSIIYDGPFYALSNDAHTGNGALELRNAYNYTTGQGIIGAAGADDDSVFSSWSSLSIIEAQIHPTELNFYYKHLPVNGDTAVARLFLFDQAGNQVGGATAFMIGNVSTYTYSSTPVVYTSLDTVYLYALSFSNYYSEADDPTQCSLGSRTLIDDVSFTFSTGVNELENSIDFSISPNPVSDRLMVKHNSKQALQFEIIDLTGKVLQAGTMNSMQPIEMQNKLAAGIYILSLQNEKVKVQRKFVVE